MLSPLLIKDRNFVSITFDALHTQAQKGVIWAKLFRRKTRLARFPEQERASVNRKFLGVQEIQIEQIVGTLGREEDFDHKFRPLRSHLRERWVDVFLSFEAEAWPPILVHKVGDQYFVEDGHHRISVARTVGIAYIRAEVWEYTTCPAIVKISQLPYYCTSACLCEACPA